VAASPLTCDNAGREGCRMADVAPSRTKINTEITQLASRQPPRRSPGPVQPGRPARRPARVVGDARPHRRTRPGDASCNRVVCHYVRFSGPQVRRGHDHRGLPVRPGSRRAAPRTAAPHRQHARVINRSQPLWFSLPGCDRWDASSAIASSAMLVLPDLAAGV